MAQTKREKAIHAKRKGSGTSMKYFAHGKEQTTNDPKIIRKLKANNRNEQGYYNTHFTPFENFLIAQGESAGEVYGKCTVNCTSVIVYYGNGIISSS